MNAASSLRASADLAEQMGKQSNARFYRDMADSAWAMGETGDALYSHWAKEIAERVMREMENHREPVRGNTPGRY